MGGRRPPGCPQDATRRQEATSKPPIGHQEARIPSSPTRLQQRPAPTRPPVPLPPDSGTDRHRDRPPPTQGPSPAPTGTDTGPPDSITDSASSPTPTRFERVKHGSKCSVLRNPDVGSISPQIQRLLFRDQGPKAIPRWPDIAPRGSKSKPRSRGRVRFHPEIPRAQISASE